MDVNEEIRQSAEKLSLTLDTPESVRQQIKQIEVNLGFVSPGAKYSESLTR
ncbi:MAG TPA: hypothetical protein V6D14_21895 [Coleofasciculaceae cyanobacterium]